VRVPALQLSAVSGASPARGSGVTDLYELAEEVLETIEAAGCSMREAADGWRGRCPLCSNDDLTLRVDEDRERLWLGCSHVSCDWREVHRALGACLSNRNRSEIRRFRGYKNVSEGPGRAGEGLTERHVSPSTITDPRS
jgi:hypothetical protein